jgi:signal transduction histidine kinase
MSSRGLGEDGLSEGSLLNGLPSVIVAAHELKTPLALVRQLSLMLEEGDFSKSEQKRMLNQISLTSEKALRLTSDLTKTIRLKDALFELEPINPKQLCEDVIREMTPMFRARNRKVKLVSVRKQSLVVGNRDLLRRLIINLSDNAINYTDDGNKIEIKISNLFRRGLVRIGIRDFGPALPKNTIKYLSSKLDGLSSTPVHARPQSSGLGLYIVGQFADAMNGNVGLIRHRDGATFYIDLQASKQLSLL